MDVENELRKVRAENSKLIRENNLLRASVDRFKRVAQGKVRDDDFLVVFEFCDTEGKARRFDMILKSETRLTRDLIAKFKKWGRMHVFSTYGIQQDPVILNAIRFKQ